MPLQLRHSWAAASKSKYGVGKIPGPAASSGMTQNLSTKGKTPLGERERGPQVPNPAVCAASNSPSGSPAKMLGLTFRLINAEIMSPAAGLVQSQQTSPLIDFCTKFHFLRAFGVKSRGTGSPQPHYPGMPHSPGHCQLKREIRDPSVGTGVRMIFKQDLELGLGGRLEWGGVRGHLSEAIYRPSHTCTQPHMFTGTQPHRITQTQFTSHNAITHKTV